MATQRRDSIFNDVDVSTLVKPTDSALLSQDLDLAAPRDAQEVIDAVSKLIMMTYLSAEDKLLQISEVYTLICKVMKSRSVKISSCSYKVSNLLAQANELNIATQQYDLTVIIGNIKGVLTAHVDN